MTSPIQATMNSSKLTDDNSLIYACPKCNKLVNPIFINGKWYKTSCNCVTAEIEKKKLEEFQRAKLNEKIQKFTNLNSNIQSKTLDNFKLRSNVKKIYAAAKDYIDNLDENIANGEGILFMGSPGVGKSHLSAAIINSAIKSGYSAIYETVPELLMKIKATYERNEESSSTESSIFNSLNNCDILVLDDIGSEKYSEWTECTIYSIVNSRYINRKSIITSSNCSFGSLEEKLGIRTLDRLAEICSIVKANTESYRKIIAREKMKGAEENE